MKFHLFFLFLIVLFSCQDNQSTANETTIEATKEMVESATSEIAEAVTETANGEMQESGAKTMAENKIAEEASKMKVEDAPKEKTQANINKIIEKAAATKPVAVPKGTSKPSTKEIAQSNEIQDTKTTVKETTKSKVVEATKPAAAPKPAPATAAVPKSAPKKAAKISHTSFDSYLKKYVSGNGNVNYSGMKGDRQPLNDYMAELAKSTPKSDWSRNEKLAYWINAYNAFTIDLILSNYPVSKITDLDGGSPWKVSRITLEGKKYSLDQIENKIIRPQFKDGRIHFAVNCAAKSCPTLLNGAFLPSKLSSQLEKQTKKFVNNSAYNSISEGSATVSKIFKWYAEDFGDLKTFLNKYSTQKIGADTNIEYNEYDWSLNGK